MEHNNVAVYVHPDQRPSGMGFISMGSLGPARRLAAHNIHLLAEAVRQGYHIVATEPSTVLCLTHEYLHLIDDNDARAVAANTSEACTYLWRLHQQGKLQLDLQAAGRDVLVIINRATSGRWKLARPARICCDWFPVCRSNASNEAAPAWRACGD